MPENSGSPSQFRRRDLSTKRIAKYFSANRPKPVLISKDFQYES
jgi:hypothetical protein